MRPGRAVSTCAKPHLMSHPDVNSIAFLVSSLLGWSLQCSRTVNKVSWDGHQSPRNFDHLTIGNINVCD